MCIFLLYIKYQINPDIYVMQVFSFAILQLEKVEFLSNK